MSAGAPGEGLRWGGAQTTISHAALGEGGSATTPGKGGSVGAPGEGEGRQVGGFVLPVRDCQCTRGGTEDGRGTGGPRIAHSYPGNAECEGCSYCEFLDVGKEWRGPRRQERGVEDWGKRHDDDDNDDENDNGDGNGEDARSEEVNVTTAVCPRYRAIDIVSILVVDSRRVISDDSRCVDPRGRWHDTMRGVGGEE